MDRSATKTHFERENDEADRLVRPSPKVKPPRKDKRRETMEPDKDPKLDTRDPDLSMSEKDREHRVSARVLTRFHVRQVFAEAESSKVKVKHKETGKTVWINKDTLKEKPGDYEVVEQSGDEGEGGDEGTKGPGGEAPEAPKPKSDAERGWGSGRKDEEKQLKQLQDFKAEIDDDPALENFVTSLLNPKSEMGNWPNDAPVHDVFIKKHPALGKLKAKNFGELRQLVNRTKHLDTYEKKVRDKWKAEDVEDAMDPEAKWRDSPGAKHKVPEKEEPPKAEAKPEEKPKGEEPKKGEPKKGEPEKGAEPPKDPAKEQALADAGTKLREQAKDDPALATLIHQLDGTDSKSLYQLQTQLEPGQTLKFPGLPPGVSTLSDAAEALKTSKPESEKPAAPAEGAKPAEGEKKPEGKKEEKPAEEAKPAQEPQKQVPPEQLLQFLEQAFGLVRKEDKTTGLHPDDKAEVDQFLKDKSVDKPDFQAWADKESSTFKGEDGKATFFDEARKKHVPFEKLTPEQQYDIIERFKGSETLNKNISDLKSLAAKDKNLDKVLRDLANPKSDLAQEIERNGSNLKIQNIKKSIPELRTLNLPDGVKSVGDLVEAANKIHEPAPEPQRREVTEKDYDKATTQIIETFPPDVADKLLSRKPPLHPDDVRDMVETYAEADSMKDDDLFEEIEKEGFYETDPDKVAPPATGKNKRGQQVPFADLSPGEQADALERHRMFVVAVSLAARAKKVAQLGRKTKAPGELLGSIAEFSLKKRPNETEEERSARAEAAAKNLFASAVSRGMMEEDADRNARWQQRRNDLIIQHQQRAKEEGEEYDEDEDDDLPPRPAPKEMSEKQLQKLLGELGDDPAARKLVVGYAQAGDYLKARHEFLDSDSETAISEHDNPKKIVQGIANMGKFFDQQAKKYPKDMRDMIPVKQTMRDRVLDKVRTLAPEKFPFVKGYVQDQEFDDYEDQLKAWEKKNHDLIEQHKSLARKRTPYRDEDKPPPLPPPPRRPEGYLNERGTPEDRKKAKKDFFEKLRGASGLPEPEATKQASMITNVLWRVQRYSSCNPLWTMTDPISSRVAARAKSALYWGVEPYPKGHEGFAPYTKWEQVHQRDLGDKDFDSILKAAREWLKAPVLSTAVEGIYRDTQLRAALDLALRDHENGKYSVGLQPPLYNRLLARLGGASQTETLLTDRDNIKGPITVASTGTPESLYAATGEGHPMKASAQIRTFAARYATTNPAVAYDLIDLAVKVAQDEQGQEPAQQDQKQGGQVPPQFLEHMKGKKDDKKEEGGQDQGQEKQAYAQLRSVVIKMAHANPHLREAYRPILETIKKLG